MVNDTIFFFCSAYLHNQKVFRYSYSSENGYHLHGKFQKVYSPTKEQPEPTLVLIAAPWVGNSPLNVHRLLTSVSPWQSLALSHTYCQILLCYINCQLFSERPSAHIWSCNSEEASATACLVRVSEGSGGVENGPLQDAVLPPPPSNTEGERIPRCSRVLSCVQGVVCIPLCSPAWHLARLSHSPPEHLTTPSGLQMEINRALEKCALKWPLLSD